MLSFLKEGFKFIKGNPGILYSLFLIIFLPLILYFNTSLSISSFQKNIDLTLQTNSLLVESVFSNMASDIISDQELLKTKIEKVLEENPEIGGIRIAVLKNGKFIVSASKFPEEIGKEIKGDPVQLSWSRDQAIAYLTTEKGERFWEVVKPVKDLEGNKIGMVGLAISLKSADALMLKAIRQSYLFVLISILISLFLIIHHTRLFKYPILLKRLQEIDKMKDDFIRMAIHELQSPIVNLRNYSEALKEEMGSGLTALQREYVSRVIISSTRLTNLISDMLEVSRIEQGRTSLVLEKVSPQEVIKEVVVELRQKAENKGLKIVFEEKPETVFISANPNRLKEILYNLIDNAIKYTFRGKIEVKIKIEETKKKCYISIEDTGTGISAQNQKRLFEKFYRVKTKETADISGTGLGLWISKTLTEKMGGEIFIESIEGIGSKFTIFFPLIK